MSRTMRGSRHDGDAQTMRGLDRCPPRWFRRRRVTKPTRAEGRQIARDAKLGTEDTPLHGVRHMPWFT